MANDATNKPTEEATQPVLPKCGLVMPISAIDDCSVQHWLDVKAILTEAIQVAGFQAELVSYTDESGIIQKTIIQNLYQNAIVVCDVSGKNPNVMFELGLRLAFDKPTIVVKDNKTDYSFDIQVIEHLVYPRDLRYAHIVTFKESLTNKVRATYDKSKNDSQYTTFLKNFGNFTVATLDTKEVSKDDFIIEQLAEMRQDMARLSSLSRRSMLHATRKDDLTNISMSLSDGQTSDLINHLIAQIVQSQPPDRPLPMNLLIKMLRNETIRHNINVDLDTLIDAVNTFMNKYDRSRRDQSGDAEQSAM